MGCIPERTIEELGRGEGGDMILKAINSTRGGI
jgi:hypothetical protein